MSQSNETLQAKKSEFTSEQNQLFVKLTRNFIRDWFIELYPGDPSWGDP